MKERVNSSTEGEEAMQKLIDVQTAFMEKLSTITPPTATSPTNVDVRLPKINIPLFDGLIFRL